MLRVESFFVGGESLVTRGEEGRDIQFTKSTPVFQVDPNGTQVINQAYVQSFVSDSFERLPVILQHGGGMTGVMWESTPDGRSGWLNYFIDKQFPTFVIDNVARGRSGWPVSELSALGKPLSRTEEEAWKLFRFGAPENFVSKEAYPRQRFPVRELDKFSAQFVPRWINHQEQSKQAMLELLDRTGPAIVVAHSHGAECVVSATQEMPENVKALVLIEPSELPIEIDHLVSHKIPLLIVQGGFMNVMPLWRHLGASYKSITDALSAAGGDATILDLDKEIGEGFSHMLMMDNGNELVFGAIIEWLEQRGLSACGPSNLYATN